MIGFVFGGCAAPDSSTLTVGVGNGVGGEAAAASSPLNVYQSEIETKKIMVHS